MAITLIGLGSAIGVNAMIPDGYRPAQKVSIDRGWTDEPGSVGAWISAENAE
jgi:hypothetical protein